MKTLRRIPISRCCQTRCAVMLSAVLTLFSACDHDDGVNFAEYVTPDDTDRYVRHYTGSFVTHLYMGEADYGATGIIDVDYLYHRLSNSDGDTLVLHDVRFSSHMPVVLSAVRIPSLSNVNAVLGQRHDTIIPEYYMPVAGWVADSAHAVTDLTGRITDDSLCVTMLCGGMPLDFGGKRKQ